MKNMIKRVLTLITAMALVLAGLNIADPVKASAADPSGKKIVVSLGDSYSSGEGIEPFFGQDKPMKERVEDEDWLAHRSQKAWSGMLKVDGQKMVKDDNWFFAASSGAETIHLYESQNKKYDKNGVSGEKGLAPQLEIFDKVEKLYGAGAVDFVTLSMGGNDVGFGSIMRAALMDPANLEANLNEIWARLTEEHTENGKTVPSIKDAIKQNYKDIEEKAGKQAAIIVAGYPTLFNAEGFSVVMYNVSAETAETVNTWTSKLNEEIRSIVEECKKEGMNIYFVSVEDAFKGHEAYTKDAYINPVMIGSQNQDLTGDMISAYSIHPNVTGAKAYAKEVQKVIDSLSKSENTDNTEKTTTAKKPELTATSKKGKITLKWTKVEGATKYRVVEYVNGKAKTVKTTKKTSLSISKRTKGNEYTFAVKAYVNKKWTKIKAADKKTVTVK